MTKASAAPTMKGYAFGLAKQKVPDPPTGGTVLANQLVKDTLYKENVHDFQAAFVFEFPSLHDAKDWYGSQRRSAFDDGPMVILEGEEFGADYRGFSMFFIKVLDTEKFSKNYKPSESLQSYQNKRVFQSIETAPIATQAAVSAFDKAVLIGFASAQDGKEWLESDEYKPQGEVRLATTSGHGVVVGSTN